ncbi:MAG TPA: hypothetical protein VIG33_06030 [Pseudobdellovibrionaceae bacterium]
MRSSAQLMTKAALPILQFERKELQDCKVDRWGNNICNPLLPKYSNPIWILADDYIPQVQWVNIETNIELPDKADFEAYRKCVESEISTL